MTRDETVTLWLACEEARGNAIVAEKSEDEAHDAASVPWHAWAARMREEREVLQKSSLWQLHTRKPLESRIQWRKRHSKTMRDWLKVARADFSALQISSQNRNPETGEPANATSFRVRSRFDWVDFRRFLFPGEADFSDARFTGLANFEGANFLGPVWFSKSKANQLRFGNAIFSETAWFRGANFDDDVSFDGARFEKEADFSAARISSGFYLNKASFATVPDFIQAHFQEAPRLDNVVIEAGFAGPEHAADGHIAIPPSARLHRALQMRNRRYRRVTGADRDTPARWRALKRLAIQAHDQDREHEFFAGEVRSARFAGDWPLPWPVWRLSGLASVLRFWFGLAYEVFSDFGRSLARPLSFWLLAVLMGAVVFISQSPEIVASRHAMEEKGIAKGFDATAMRVSAIFSKAWHAWLAIRRPCYAGEAVPLKDANGDMPPYVAALSPSLQSGTDLANEAWHLAFRNAFIILDGSSEASHRTYGCLYGVELYGGGNPIAVVPSAVSTASAIQKLFSGAMIFLFGLALRNMLKMK